MMADHALPDGRSPASAWEPIVDGRLAQALGILPPDYDLSRLRISSDTGLTIWAPDVSISPDDGQPYPLEFPCYSRHLDFTLAAMYSNGWDYLVTTWNPWRETLTQQSIYPFAAMFFRVGQDLWSRAVLEHMVFGPNPGITAVWAALKALDAAATREEVKL